MILGIFDKQVNQYEINKIGLVVQPIKTPNKRTIMTWSLGKPIWHARPTYPAMLHGWTLCLGWCWIRLCFLADLALNRSKHIGECVKTYEVAFVLLFFYIGSWQRPSLFPVNAPFIFNSIYNRIHGHFLDQLFSPGVLFEGFLYCFFPNRNDFLIMSAN